MIDREISGPFLLRLRFKRPAATAAAVAKSLYSAHKADTMSFHSLSLPLVLRVTSVAKDSYSCIPSRQMARVV